MAILPCGHRVLLKVNKYVEQDDVMRRAKALGIQLELDKHTRYDASVDKGVILKVGETAWKDFGSIWAKEGDTVVFAKNSGKFVEDPSDPDSDSKTYQYVLLNDEDVVAVIKE